MGRFPKIHRVKQALLVIGLVFFSGCHIQNQLAQKYEPFNLQTSVAQAIESSEFKAGEWICGNWWELFNDPQLDQLINLGIENSPTLQMAIERVSLAYEVSKEAFAPMLPDIQLQFVDFFAGISRNNNGLRNPTALFTSDIAPRWINLLGNLLNFKWRIDLWGAQKKLYLAAVDQAQMQLAEASYSKLILSTQIAQVYFEYGFYQKLISQESLMLQNQEQALNILEEMYKFALADEMQLQEQEKSILQSGFQLTQLNQKLELSINKLKTLIAMNPSLPFTLNEPQTSFTGPIPFPQEIPIQLLAKRADVVAKIWQVESMAKKVKSAKVSFLPTIDLGSISGYFNLRWDNLLDPRGWFSSVIPAATLPIFKGLQLRIQLKQSIRRYNMAVHEYNQTLLNAAQEVVDGISSYRFSNQLFSQQSQIIQKSSNLEELAQARYDNGLNNYLEVLQATWTKLRDEKDLAQCQYMQMLSVLNLIKALGGGYQNPQAESLNLEKQTL